MTISPKYERYAFLIVLGIALYLSFILLRGYFTAIIGGAIIAYFLYPFYKMLDKKIKSSSISATIVSIAAFLAVALVIAITIPQIISETERFSQTSKSFLESQTERLEKCDSIGSLYCTVVSPYADALKTDGNSTLDLVRVSSDFVLSSFIGNLGAIAGLILKLAVMGFAVFYFLEHGQYVARRILDILPLHQAHEDILSQRVKDTMDAVIKGTVTTSILQGALGGVVFYLLGLPAPFLWGVVMTILAFIPTTGVALVWIPAAIILFFTGNVIEGIILTIFGFVVLGYIDNIMKPRMIGNKIQISSFVMLLSVIGGLAVFGIAGFFLGPLIISLTIVLINFFEKEIMHG